MLVNCASLRNAMSKIDDHMEHEDELCRVRDLVQCKNMPQASCGNQSHFDMNEIDDETVLRNAINLLPRDLGDALSRNVSDMVKQCTVNGANCFFDSQNQYKLPGKGRCFVVNFFGEIGTSIDIGRLSGISMVLKVDLEDAPARGIEDGKQGFQVYIHEPMQLPSLE